MRTIRTLAVFAATATFVLSGCALETDPTADLDGAGVENESDGVDSSSDALSALGKKLVGDLTYGSGENFYETLSLGKSGKYTATWKPCPRDARCATRLEAGKWKAKAPNYLTLTPTAPAASAKTFTLSIAGDGSGFKITRGGKTERLDRLAASGESCGFRVQTRECANGLECRWVSGPRDALTCAAPVGQVGDFCGGIAAITCADDLVCALDGTYPDAGGTCTRCAIPSCAAPPSGCHYESVKPLPGTCAGCGKLVCGDGSM